MTDLSEPPDLSITTRLLAASAATLLPEGYVVAMKYQIKRLLGSGGNGAVYEAQHLTIGHRVAIKVVHTDLKTRQDAIARFRHEARVCGTIRNPHVAQVYDVGELADGAPYLVMELLDGRSLASLLWEAPITMAMAVDIVCQTLVGLQAAHGIGVIHRDVKPGNIMIVQEPGADLLVKIVDFGISKSISGDLELRDVTLDGQVVGSPDYMAPEQLKGEVLDRRVDVYAAGVVLYEAITGIAPFDGKSLTELFDAILSDPLVPPRQLRMECPASLDSVVCRALARNPAERYPSALAMRRALLDIRSSEQLDDFATIPAKALNSLRAMRQKTSLPVALASVRPEARQPSTPPRAPDRNWAERLAAVAHTAAFRQVAAAGRLVALAVIAQPEMSQSPRVDRAAVASVVAPQLPLVASPPRAAAQPASSASVPPSAELGASSGQASAEDATVGPPMPRPAAPARAQAEGGRHEAALRPNGSARSEPSAPEGAREAGDALLRYAFAAFVRGQMPRARTLYRKATLLAPDHAAAWRGLGMVSSRLGSREEAKRAFEQYLRLQPDAPDARAIRARLKAL